MKPVRNSLNIEQAKRAAISYCEINNLSVGKLSAQRVIDLGASVIFGQPRPLMDLHLFGLERDIDTQPWPTLVLRKTGRGYEVEETPYTRQYLEE